MGHVTGVRQDGLERSVRERVNAVASLLTEPQKDAIKMEHVRSVLMASLALTAV